MAANARDENRVPNIAGVSSITFTGNVQPAVNPSTHALLVEATLTPVGTQDTNLIQVGGVSFSLGQQLATASLPVVLTAAQISTLTPLSTVAVTQSTSPWVVSQTTASNLNATVVGTGTFATQSTLQTQTDTVMVGGMNIKEINAVTPLMGNGTTGTGSLRVTIASDNTAFSVNAIQSGTWTVQPGNTQNTTPWLTASSANTGAVGTTISYQSALTNTKTAIKASAGNLYGWHIYNPNNAVTYIQIWNKTTGNVTVGTTAPDDVLVVPQQGWLDDPSFVPPIGFNTAITVAATTTASGLTAPSSNLVATFYYI